jgi:hypothetical protein
MSLLKKAKTLAQKYYTLSGKPLGVTGELAEYEAARILRVKLTSARQAGHDAVERSGVTWKKLQIKGRCLQPNCKPGQRIGSIRIEGDWDSVLMVLLDHEFNATQIFEAKRRDIVAALIAPGSRARNERFALSVSKFKSIGKLRWERSRTSEASATTKSPVNPKLTSPKR